MRTLPLLILLLLGTVIDLVAQNSSTPDASRGSVYNGTFTSEFGNAYTISIAPGSIAGTVKRNENGFITEGTATLQKAGREVRIEVTKLDGGKSGRRKTGSKRKGLIVHFQGNVFHWFEDGNRTNKPVLMRKTS